MFQNDWRRLTAEEETMAAFGQLPMDQIEKVLAPIDFSTFDVDDCMTEEEIDSLLSSATDG